MDKEYHVNDLMMEQVALLGFAMFLTEGGLTPREIGEKILNIPRRPFEAVGGFENSNANTILEGLRLLQKQQDDQTKEVENG